MITCFFVANARQWGQDGDLNLIKILIQAIALKKYLYNLSLKLKLMYLRSHVVRHEWWKTWPQGIAWDEWGRITSPQIEQDGNIISAKNEKKMIIKKILNRYVKKIKKSVTSILVKL